MLLSDKEKKMNMTMRWKILPIIIIVILTSIIPSCGNKKEDEIKPIITFYDSLTIKSEAKKIFGDDFKILLIGNFDGDTTQEAVAGIELTENNTWGIKFVLLKTEENKLLKKYSTNLLEGSFKESTVKRIKFANFNHELVYYSSEDYFWGSGGGEVFSYVINLVEEEVYYAHLFSETRREIELFLSENIKDSDLRMFFVSTFKKDYPELKMASQDVSLDF